MNQILKEKKSELENINRRMAGYLSESFIESDSQVAQEYLNEYEKDILKKEALEKEIAEIERDEI